MCQKPRFNKLMSGHKQDLTFVLQSIRNRLAQCVCVCVCVGVCACVYSSSRSVLVVGSILIPKQHGQALHCLFFFALDFQQLRVKIYFPNTIQSDHKLKWKCWCAKASEHKQQFATRSIAGRVQFLNLYYLIFFGHLGAEESHNKMNNTPSWQITTLSSCYGPGC